jgi:hypothetical protein
MRYPLTDAALTWLEMIFAERFGHVWHLTPMQDSVKLSLEGASGAICFDNFQPTLLEAHSDQSCSWWDGENEGWNSVLKSAIPAPGATLLPFPLIEEIHDQYFIHYDILGLTYWMLARVEEMGRTDLDGHERFPATSSHAFKYGYLDRPIVDQWLDILGQVIQRQWPKIELKRHEFHIQVTHDVDEPSLYAFKPWITVCRMMAGHIFKRRDVKAFFVAPYVKLATRRRLLDCDPYNTFEWLMDVSEANNLKSAFYFICGRTDLEKDGDYELNHPAIRNLLSSIHQRGHEIGLHPSYGSYKNPGALKKEVERLQNICAEQGITQAQWGGRMHYLRWMQPMSMNLLADLGINYDCTLGYADYAGFRCGTCHEYPAFDAEKQKLINLRCRPLISMEGSIISSMYMGYGLSLKAEQEFLNLKKTCSLFKGCFSLLWHNSYLHQKEATSIYKNVLSCKV